MDTLRHDLQHALRILAKSPGFALGAVVMLALGIGANTAIFGFMNALLLRPFPLLEMDRLASIWERHPQEGAPGGARGGDQNPLAVADYLDLQGESTGTESVAAYRYREFVVTDAGEPARVPGYLVTPGYFDTLGIRPVMGRPFRAEEGTPGRDAVVILSHGFWQRRFASDPSILDRSFVLGGRRHLVVGVLPPALNFPPGRPDVFVPLAFSDAEKTERARLSLLVVARLRAARRGAQQGLDAFSARLAGQHPDTNAGRTLLLVPLREMQTGFTAPFLLLIEGAAAFVLLIACANVAGLLIAQGAGRRREMALRAALGASQGRIARQLLTEGFVLSALGAGAGLWLAQGGVELIRTSLPADMVRWIVGWSEIRMDSRTFAFTLGLAVVTTLVSGLLPAFRTARADLIGALKACGHDAPVLSKRRLRGGLMAFQVSLAVVLLAGAVLMTRGFRQLVGLYQGFSPEQVLTLRLQLPEWQYPDEPGVSAFYARVIHGLEATAGVESAGVVSHPPADLGPIPRSSFLVEGRPASPLQAKPTADVQTISAGYLGALKVGLQRGRAFTDADGPRAAPVALVSASLAERFWPGQDAVGRRVRIGEQETWRTVVGVVEDVKQYWFDRERRPTLYVPYLQAPRRDLFLAVRSPLDTAALVAAARERVREVDPRQPLDEIRTMATVVSESASFIRLAAALAVTLGLVALLLAAGGLYGVIAEQAARRTREIGIRMALGARGPDVLRLVVGQAARLAGLGLACGLLGALALGRLMASALFGVVRPDLASLAVVIGVLFAVALAASWIPARRATRVDPLLAIREE